MNCIYCGRETRITGCYVDGCRKIRRRKCTDCKKVFYSEELASVEENDRLRYEFNRSAYEVKKRKEMNL